VLLEMQRHVETKCFGGFEIDRHFVLDWCLDWKLARLRAVEDAIGIDRRAPKIIGPVNSIGQ
jgi:vancomycin permeability regulator SanA